MFKSLLLAICVVVFPANVQDKPNLLKPTNKADSWRFETMDGGKGELKVEEDAVVFDVAAVDSTDWHVQAVQSDLDLKDGKDYILKFKAKGAERRSIMVNAMIDQDDWHEIGLHEDVYLTKEYSDFEFRFKASNTVAKKNRIGFVLGTAKGTVYVKEVTLTEK